MLMFIIGRLACCTWLITVYQKYEALDPGFTFRWNENWLIFLKQAYAFFFYFNLSCLFLTGTEGISQPPWLYGMEERTK